MQIDNSTVIAIFAFKRPLHTRLITEALLRNHNISNYSVYFFCDASNNASEQLDIQETRKFIQSIEGFKSKRIFIQNEPLGLANSIIRGVTQCLESFSQVIVLEDDILTDVIFLNFMNLCLEKYKDAPFVFGVGGYNYPNSLLKFPPNYPWDTYFSIRPSSWGWATWKDRWERIIWENPHPDKIRNKRLIQCLNRGGTDLHNMLFELSLGKIDSWAIRYLLHHFLNKHVTIFPRISLVDNIGFDGTGRHCSYNTKLSNQLENKRNKTWSFPPTISSDMNLQKSIAQINSYSFFYTLRLTLSRLRKKFISRYHAE